MTRYQNPWNVPELPVSGRAAMVSVAGLGQAPDDVDLTPQAYATASLIGANIGGGVLGYLASADGRGAAIGAAFAGGLAGLGNTVMLARERRKGAAVIMGVMGAASIAASIHLFAQRRGGRRRSWR